MITFDLRYIVPRFILADSNGMAIAKAMEAGLRYYLERAGKGIDILFDVASMPEWRLDEIAWEENLLYDYTADIEEKRNRIIGGRSAGSLYGTIGALKHYIHGDRDDATVEEWFDYGGEPYHYRISIDGRQDEERVRWIKKIIDEVTNVRSVIDKVTLTEAHDTQAYVGMALHQSFRCSTMTGQATLDGIDWLADENGDMLLDGRGRVLINKDGDDV